MNLAIIGAGKVGSTLGRRWAQAGHEVTFGVRNPTDERSQTLASDSGGRVTTQADAAAGAEVVVLTVPFDAVPATVRELGDLSGKLLIDCTNAVGTGYTPAVEGAASGAELVAGLAPGALVVKAFNSVGVGMLGDLELGAQRGATFICGDDEAAKATVRRLGEDLGFEVVDVGPLAAAPLVESVALLWITLAYRQQLGTDFVFGLIRRPA